MKKQVKVSVPFAFSVEVLRETDQAELDIFDEKLDGEHGGWYWIADVVLPATTSGGYLQGHGYCDTEKEALEDAKEYLKKWALAKSYFGMRRC